MSAGIQKNISKIEAENTKLQTDLEAALLQLKALQEEVKEQNGGQSEQEDNQKDAGDVWTLIGDVCDKYQTKSDIPLLLNKNYIKAVRKMIFIVVKKAMGISPLPDGAPKGFQKHLWTFRPSKDVSLTDQVSGDANDEEEDSEERKILPFKVMGIGHKVERQNHLKAAFIKREDGNIVVCAKIEPEPDNMCNTNAIRVLIDYGVGFKPDFKTIRQKVEPLQSALNVSKVNRSLESVRILACRPAMLLDPFALLASLEQLTDHTGEANHPQHKKFEAIFKQRRHPANSKGDSSPRSSGPRQAYDFWGNNFSVARPGNYPSLFGHRGHFRHVIQARAYHFVMLCHKTDRDIILFPSLHHVFFTCPLPWDLYAFRITNSLPSALYVDTTTQNLDTSSSVPISSFAGNAVSDSFVQFTNILQSGFKKIDVQAINNCLEHLAEAKPNES
ncbi:hypothetical protein ACROYT_G014881 [Oculina patagonica]